jgi:hypothetical protein
MILLPPDKLDRCVTRERVAAPRALDRGSRRLLDHARLLPLRQRLLLALIFEHNLSLRTVGQIVGMPAGTVSRHVRRVWRRLAQPIAADLCADDCPLPKLTRQIAIDFFITGLPTSRIAVERAMSRQSVRDHLNIARGWQRATRRA